MTPLRLLLVGLFALALTGAAAAPRFPADDEDADASTGLRTQPPHAGVQASFTARSYPPGATATLALRGSAPGLSVAFFRAGAGHDGPLQGALVRDEQPLHAHGSVRLVLGNWRSGFYYASVVTPGSGAWYAPFVVRPRHLGSARVLVVLPTNTWQAYNFEDGGSWYLDHALNATRLDRPYIDGGVPPHYHGYDRGFLRWLALHGKRPDFVADDDLERLSGENLARYSLLVFPGHEEYVTPHAYAATVRYRDLGGNIAFLSANAFFYRVVRHGDTIDRDGRWRDLGRPEAPLVGGRYVGWNEARYPNRPFTVTGVEQAPWLFRHTGLRDGDRFGVYGIEVAARAADSPSGTVVLARIAGIFGAGRSAEMTYYTTPAGAKVFSAGVMNFGGSSLWPVVSRMMENLWGQLAQP